MESLEKEEGEKISIKTGVEVFCETLPDFGEAGVHPALNKGVLVTWIRAVEVEDLESGRTHIAGDGDVLDHMIMDRFMAFDFFIGISSKQDELPIGCSKASQGAFGPVGEIKEDEEMNKRNDESFTPCEGFQIGP